MRSYPLRAGAALAAALVLGPAPAGAGGFEVLEHGAAATGMAGAFTAKADDVSALNTCYWPGRAWANRNLPDGAIASATTRPFD